MLARSGSGSALAKALKPSSCSAPVTSTYTAKRIAKRFCASHRRRCASLARLERSSRPSVLSSSSSAAGMVMTTESKGRCGR